jgi:hypothetical protein
MVRLNNSYRGANSPNMDAYLRNLNDLRVGIEVNVLPVLGHFIANSEASDLEGKVLVPSKIIESERKYLEHLRQQYFKRDFDFVADPDSSQKSYDVLTKLIRQTRQATSYCQLDIYDFMVEHPKVFEGVELPPNVAISVNETGEIYHHDKIDPQYLESIIEAHPRIDPLFSADSALPQIRKYRHPFQLYFSILGDVKRTLDFELLKMYDFLVEQGKEEVRSTKLLEILDCVRTLGEREYYKQRFAVKVKPFGRDYEPDNEDLVLDEWASNLRRVITLKDGLTTDFIDYLSEAPEEEIFIYRSGSYPELFSLINDRFKGNIPEDLRRFSAEDIRLKIGSG